MSCKCNNGSSLGCACDSSLGAFGLASRPMTSGEIANFLFRHPVVAARIAETEAIMNVGRYDWDYNPATGWPFPGLIPPWGLQVDDSSYGLVTVFPARDGSWRYTAFSAVDLGADKPGYISPKGPCPAGTAEIAGLCVPSAPSFGSIGAFLLLGVAVYAYVNRR